jgi:hypothetical protein
MADYLTNTFYISIDLLDDFREVSFDVMPCFHKVAFGRNVYRYASWHSIYHEIKSKVASQNGNRVVKRRMDIL